MEILYNPIIQKYYMKYIKLIESRLEDDAQKFASVYDSKIRSWIIDCYSKGYKSSRDYDDINKWIISTNHNINNYSFDSALSQAKSYLERNRKNKFNKNAELNCDNIIMDFDDGNKWININLEELNSLINRLQFDCHDELSDVYQGNGDCWALIDAQNNIRCIVYKDSHGYNAIGKGGCQPNNHKEIKALCVRKGIDLIPAAFSDIGLINAIKSKQIDISQINDWRSFLDRLSAEDIVDCGLINYCHHDKINKIYDVYKISKHDCLLLYCLAYLICHNLTDTKAYTIIIKDCNSNKNISNIISKINSNDTREYLKLMDDCVNQISRIK